MRFRQQKANAGPVSLAHKGLSLPRCIQDILPSNLRKNFSYLALLAMQHYRLAFQNSFSVWTTYEIDPLADPQAFPKTSVQPILRVGMGCWKS
jgi:hypothetical protein